MNKKLEKQGVDEGLLKKLRHDGMSNKEISSYLDISYNTVLKMIGGANKNTVSPEDMQKKREEGMSNREIARFFGVCTQTVRNKIGKEPEDIKNKHIANIYPVYRKGNDSDKVFEERPKIEEPDFVRDCRDQWEGVPFPERMKMRDEFKKSLSGASKVYQEQLEAKRERVFEEDKIIMGKIFKSNDSRYKLSVIEDSVILEIDNLTTNMNLSDLRVFANFLEKVSDFNKQGDVFK